MMPAFNVCNTLIVKRVVCRSDHNVEIEYTHFMSSVGRGFMWEALFTFPVFAEYQRYESTLRTIKLEVSEREIISVLPEPVEVISGQFLFCVGVVFIMESSFYSLSSKKNF
jgi:hypothetical protein